MKQTNHDTFEFKFIKPEGPVADFVEIIGMFQNKSDEAKDVVLIPDGRIDLLFFQTSSGAFEATLVGLGTVPEQRDILPHTLAFVVSFKPLAVEYVLQTPIADILDSAKMLPQDAWSFDESDFTDLDTFYKQVLLKVKDRLPKEIDERKRELFALIYSSNGEMTVKELSEKVFWSSRQINRYFNKQLGLSLKAFCTILRFRASLEHIARGRLFPELNFTDQAHFIKEIKKFSGVVPKELAKNPNDRFVLLSVLKQG